MSAGATIGFLVAGCSQGVPAIPRTQCAFSYDDKMDAGDRGSEAAHAEVDAIVSATGEVVIAPEDVRRLALVPGERVRVSVAARPRRRNMYGVLAGRLPDVDQDDLRRVRRSVWGELASDQ